MGPATKLVDALAGRASTEETLPARGNKLNSPREDENHAPSWLRGWVFLVEPRSVKLSYKLTGQGWASAVILDDDRRFAMERISYLSDAFNDLLQAAIGLLEGAGRVWFLWHDEPGEHRWIIHRTDDDLLIRILWFDDAFKAAPDEKGTELFQLHCRLANFTGEVLACGRSLLAEHTEHGYREEWGSEFPEEEFGRLEWLIGERRKRKRTGKGSAAV